MGIRMAQRVVALPAVIAWLLTAFCAGPAYVSAHTEAKAVDQWATADTGHSVHQCDPVSHARHTVSAGSGHALDPPALPSTCSKTLAVAGPLSTPTPPLYVRPGSPPAVYLQTQRLRL